MCTGRVSSLPSLFLSLFSRTMTMVAESGEKENVLPEKTAVPVTMKRTTNATTAATGDNTKEEKEDAIRKEEQDEDEERERVIEAANATKESSKQEEEEEEEDFIHIKRRVRGTEQEEEEEEELVKEAEKDDNNNNKEEGKEEEVNASYKKKSLRHKSGERVAKNDNVGDRDGDDAVGGDKFEFEIEEEEEEEEEDMDEEDDEERILERRFAETGRLSEDEEEEEESESELNFSSSESDSEEEDEGGRGRKTTRKGSGRKKKPIDPNDKDAVMQQKKEDADKAHEKLMRKAAKHIHFPGYRVQAEPTSFLPVIEKLQNNLRMVECDEDLRRRYPRPPPSPEKKEFHEEGDVEGSGDGRMNDDPEDEVKDSGEEKTDFDKIDGMNLLSEEEEEEMLELCNSEEESDSEDEAADAEFIRKSIAKKTKKVVDNPIEANDDDAAKENRDKDSKDSDDDELSEEEEMTKKEIREQRKQARNFFKEDLKNRKKERRSRRAIEGVDDEAEMSEDGGHTDDDEKDDIETAHAEIEEMADFVDFREGTALDVDERRNEARARAHAEREIQKDDEEVKNMKELIANGFKRTRKGLNGEDDDDGKWKSRRKQERGDDSESDSDSDDMRNLRLEEAVQVSDDEDAEDKAFKERQAQRFAMKKKDCAKEPVEKDALPEVNEGNKVSEEVMKLFEKENKKSKKNSNKGQGTTQNQMIVNDLSNRAGGSGSGLSGLSRGNSQFSNLGTTRTMSTSFLKRNGSSKSQSGFVKGINGGASRTFVFGSTLDNSNSQWATQKETESMPCGNNLLGGDEARTGFADDVANNINLSASMKEKKSLFAMLQKSTAPQDWEKEDSRIKSVVGKKD